MACGSVCARACVTLEGGAGGIVNQLFNFYFLILMVGKVPAEQRESEEMKSGCFNITSTWLSMRREREF